MELGSGVPIPSVMCISLNMYERERCSVHTYCDYSYDIVIYRIIVLVWVCYVTCYNIEGHKWVSQEGRATTVERYCRDAIYIYIYILQLYVYMYIYIYIHIHTYIQAYNYVTVKRAGHARAILQRLAPVLQHRGGSRLQHAGLYMCYMCLYVVMCLRIIIDVCICLYV